MEHSMLKTKFLAFKITEETYKTIKKLAFLDKRTVMDYCRVVIERHCEEKNPEKTERGANDCN